jgi:hypothetical protein
VPRPARPDHGTLGWERYGTASALASNISIAMIGWPVIASPGLVSVDHSRNTPGGDRNHRVLSRVDDGDAVISSTSTQRPS